MNVITYFSLSGLLEMTENVEDKLRREHEEFKRRHEESCALIKEVSVVRYMKLIKSLMSSCS